MPEGVTYTKQSEAAAYAKTVGGTVVPVDRDGDGVTDGFNVIEQQQPGRDEGVTGRTFEGSSVDSATGATSGPTTVLRNMGGAMVDELGYMRGGMTEEKRGPIKYAVGGAIKGKNFTGIF